MGILTELLNTTNDVRDRIIFNLNRIEYLIKNKTEKNEEAKQGRGGGGRVGQGGTRNQCI
jgi:hypothetical protein